MGNTAETKNTLATLAKNLSKKYNPDKFTPSDQQKTEGITNGNYLISTSKKDPTLKKLWLKKKTMTESHLDVILDKKSPFEKVAQSGEQIINSMIRMGLKKDNDADIMRISNIITGSVLKSMEEGCEALTEKLKLLQAELYTLIEYELASEVLSAEIVKAITGRKDTPKYRVLHNEKEKSHYILSRIAFDQTPEGKQSEDLFDFITTEGRLDTSRIESKPLHGLYEAIIIRLFLMDNPNDVKLGNMIVVEHDNYFQVENIDYGFTFSYNHSEFLRNGVNAESLIKKISEIGITCNNGNMQFFNLLMKHANPDEIEQTLKRISNFKDEDLRSITESLSAIKYADEDATEVIYPEMRNKFFNFLKGQQSVIQECYRKFISDHKAFDSTTVRENVEYVDSNLTDIEHYREPQDILPEEDTTTGEPQEPTNYSNDSTPDSTLSPSELEKLVKSFQSLTISG